MQKLCSAQTQAQTPAATQKLNGFLEAVGLSIDAVRKDYAEHPQYYNKKV